MDRFRDDDADTLIVSCDWLVWQDAVNRGLHCTSYEEGLFHTEVSDAAANDSIVWAGAFFRNGREDRKRFGGVSIGSELATSIRMAYATHAKLGACLRGLVHRYAPREIVFVDFRAERLNPPAEDRRMLVRACVQSLGVGFIDQSDVVDDDDPLVASFPQTDAAPNDGWSLKKIALELYQIAVDRVTRLNPRYRSRPHKTFLWLGQNMSAPLIAGFTGAQVAPIFLARTMPKSFRFVSRCLRRGIALVALAHPRLTRQERLQLAQVRQQIASDRLTYETEIERRVAQCILDHFLDPARVEHIARQIKGSRRLFDSVQPDRLVVDGLKNFPGRAFIELAHARGIPVDYIWHAPLAPMNVKFDALGCDPAAQVLVTRCLSWGAVNDAWISRIGACVPALRVGNPILGRYPRAADASRRAGSGRVLVLQYSTIHSDIKAPSALQFAYFVDVVRLLRAEGYRDIRMKLHMGHWRAEYFERIAHAFGLDCTVHMNEPFQQFVDWADFAIGPVHSGAMLEVLAARKDYYAVLLEPTSLDPSYLDSVMLHRSVAALRETIRNRVPTRREAILNDFCSLRDIPDPVGRFWEAMESATVVPEGIPPRLAEGTSARAAGPSAN